MMYSRAKKWLKAALIVTALLWTGLTTAATPAGWKESGFSIDASGMSLREVLNEFGSTYGVRVSIAVRSDARMKGRLKGESGSDFLDRLMHTYRFRWFVYNSTLYIVPDNDTTSMRLEVGEDAVQDAKSALVGLGLFDSRFGWGELPDEGTVVVSGPRQYVNLARDILLPEERGASAKGKQLMVFRLKYASATDRIINIRGQKETLPGIKTILNNLLNGGAEERAHDLTEFDVGSEKRSRHARGGKGSARETGLRTTNVSDRYSSDAESEDIGQTSRGRSAKKTERPRIDADPSLNAIIIYDNVSKRAMYKSLIAQLDIEPQQVEIEALIVDIDRTKLSDLGVEWGVRKGDTITRVNGTASDSRGIELPIPGSTLLISNAAKFYARLRALEGAGEARVLAKPTVLTLDNVAAVLDLSQTSYVPLVGERVADLADITAGTMLRVVPRIVRDGGSTRVRLEVDIEDGSLGNNPQKTSSTRSTISTQAIIDLQQTLMIGGYHAESVSKDMQKVPVLGDVPLFGGLFRQNVESYGNRERLFLITPRLAGVSGLAQAPAESKATRSARDVAKAQGQDVAPDSPAAPGSAAPATNPPIAPPGSSVLEAANPQISQPNDVASTQWGSPRISAAGEATAQLRPRKPHCARFKQAVF